MSTFRPDYIFLAQAVTARNQKSPLRQTTATQFVGPSYALVARFTQRPQTTAAQITVYEEEIHSSVINQYVDGDGKVHYADVGNLSNHHIIAASRLLEDSVEGIGKKMGVLVASAAISALAYLPLSADETRRRVAWAIFATAMHFDPDFRAMIEAYAHETERYPFLTNWKEATTPDEED